VVRASRHDLSLLTGAYVADAIEDPAERSRFEQHMRHCPQCATEVRGLAETATRLAFAAARPAPRSMRDRVLGAASRTRQLSPAAEHHRSVDRAPRPIRPTWITVAAAATGLAAAVCLGVAITLGVALRHADHKLAQAQARQAVLERVLEAPDARAATGTVSEGGTVTVVYSISRHSLLVTSAGLHRQLAGKVYELWLIAGKHAKPAGLLPVRPSGRTAPFLVTGARKGEVLAMTIEPAGGTPQPTTKPILVLPLRG
jgi:anti-sigma-K factor RskA